jgi:AraC-like DNA-binding protein
MVAHLFPESEDTDRKILTVILGLSFLKKHFSYLSNIRHKIYSVENNSGSDTHKKLYSTLVETAEFCQDKDRRELLVRGNLYKMCSYLIDIITASNDLSKAESKEMVKVANIEKALEMIYYDYSSPLTVDEAAVSTGYGKSHFCKIFKNIIGDTFHNVLNRHRVEVACGLLSQTNMPISEIAVQVGFAETKTFCRVFKAETSVTPGQYRKCGK